MILQAYERYNSISFNVQMIYEQHKQLKRQTSAALRKERVCGFYFRNLVIYDGLCASLMTLRRDSAWK